MHQLNRVRDSSYELVKLAVIDDQWGCNFENHEIIPTDLGQHAVIPEKPHYQNLSEHAWVDSKKRLEGYAQVQFSRSGELNSVHQANAANILDHFVMPKHIAQTGA